MTIQTAGVLIFSIVLLLLVPAWAVVSVLFPRSKTPYMYKQRDAIDLVLVFLIVIGFLLMLAPSVVHS